MRQFWLYTCCWMIVAHTCVVTCVDPVTAITSVGISIGTAIFGSVLKAIQSSCYFGECCYPPHVELNLTGLDNDLNKKVYGQHLVIPTVLKSVKAHLTDTNPSKPLVLSFHGITTISLFLRPLAAASSMPGRFGVGKNFVSQIIVDNIFQKKEKSQFVHWIHPDIHFKDPKKIDIYKDNLHSWIHHNMSNCERSIFIFDEMDHMHEGILDILFPFLGHNAQVDGVNYRKSIFIFLSNTAGDPIMQTLLQHREKGKKRTDITLQDLERPLKDHAYNTIRGFRKSKLVERDLVDYFIPFLPLERDHVRSCIIDELRRKNTQCYGKSGIDRFLDELTWEPKNLKLYSKSGCKKVAQKIGLFVDDI